MMNFEKEPKCYTIPTLIVVGLFYRCICRNRRDGLPWK